MRPSEVSDHIRHLAAAGVPDKTAVTAMVDALDGMVSSVNKVLMWVDEQGHPCDIYETNPNLSVRNAFFEQALATPDPDEPSIEAIIGFQKPFGSWFPLQDHPRWQRSLMLNELFRPYGVGNNFDFKFYWRGRPIGLLAIDREPGSRMLSRDEVSGIARLADHFAYAISAPTPGANAGQYGRGALVTLVAGTDGTILSMGPGAERVLDHVERLAATPIRGQRNRLPDAFRPLLALANKRSPSAPALIKISGDWGMFEARAHPQRPTGNIAITIEHLRDRRIAMIERVAELDLSAGERRLAAALAGPDATDDIARKFGLTMGSYRQAALRIYNRLDVAGRAGVTRLLN